MWNQILETLGILAEISSFPAIFFKPVLQRPYKLSSPQTLHYQDEKSKYHCLPQPAN